MKAVDPTCPEAIFMESMSSMLKCVGIDQMHEAMDYFKLMKEAVYRELFNRLNPNNTQRYREAKGRQTFIAIFKFRYRQTYDIDYNVPISDKDASVITKFLKNLEVSSIPIDMYLEWYFEDYITRRKRDVESIMFPCQRWVLQSFMLDNRDRLEDIKNKQVEEKERSVLFERARSVIRDSKFVCKELGERVINTLKEYNDSAFGLDDLRDRVCAFEEELGKVKRRL